jgi:Flp pilus assembly protein CpaB
MDRNRMATGLTIAFVVALLFSLYMYRTIRRITAVKPATTRQIVVANRPVQLGTRLDATNLRARLSREASPGSRIAPGVRCLRTWQETSLSWRAS